MAKQNAKVAAKKTAAKTAAPKKAARKPLPVIPKAKAKPEVKLGDPQVTYDSFIDQVDQLQGHMEQFASGKKVAASRARKAANEIRKLMSLFRKEIQAAKAAM